VLLVDQEPDPRLPKGTRNGHIVLPEIVVSEYAEDPQRKSQRPQEVGELQDVMMIEGHVVPAQKEHVGCSLGNMRDGRTKQSRVGERPRVQVGDEGDPERRNPWVRVESEGAAVQVQVTL
jgi:hypothetical protein